MQVDYIIVGLGLAGLAFAEELTKNNKSFIVFEDSSQQSSLVAAGTYNPIVLKRFNAVWDVQKQLELALPLYKKLEERFHAIYDYPIDIHRIFTSVEEQNNWFVACDKPVLDVFMDPSIVTNTNAAIKAPFGFGKVVGTGWIDTNSLLKDYRKHLSDKALLLSSRFDYEKIEFNDDSINYKNISARKIIFCEGFGMRKNPYFKELPMEEAKGELLTIHAPELQLKTVLKGAVFVQPIGNDTYKVGATFNWEDKTLLPTTAAKNELLKKLETMIAVPYEVIDHKAGIRPTTKDRRPLVGIHKIYKQLAILNGLGTRGVLLGPSMAKELYEYLEEHKEVHNEISIERFY
jgi:glycine oxidase